MRTAVDKPVLSIRIPSLPPAEYSANNARGAAWGRQYRVSHGERGAVSEVVALVKEQGWGRPPLKRAVVELYFVLPDHRRRDAPSLLERVKPWLDGLVTAKVLVDDDLKTIGWPRCHHGYGRSAATIINVFEVTDDPAQGV